MLQTRWQSAFFFFAYLWFGQLSCARCACVLRRIQQSVRQDWIQPGRSSSVWRGGCSWWWTSSARLPGPRPLSCSPWIVRISAGLLSSSPWWSDWHFLGQEGPRASGSSKERNRFLLGRIQLRFGGQNFAEQDVGLGTKVTRLDPGSFEAHCKGFWSTAAPDRGEFWNHFQFVLVFNLFFFVTKRNWKKYET